MSAAGGELQQTFKQAMRRVAATVNIISIWADGEPMGITATAMSSLAMEPPSLLICMNRAASVHPSMAKVTHFRVNVLHRDQEFLAQIFADRAKHALRFGDGWVMDGSGPPRLAAAQASMLCRITDLHQFGTHSIFIGVVEDALVREDVDPLVYLDGRFGSVGCEKESTVG